MPPNFITVRGRKEAVLEEIQIQGKSFPVLEKLGSKGRDIFRVFDGQAGPHGDFRAVHFLPRSAETEQRIEIIRRLKQGNRNFPGVILYVPEHDRVVVVFEWVWGQNLGRLLTKIRAGKAPRFSVFEAIKRMRVLAHMLGVYHRETNLVHGDVKPDNVIVTERPHDFVLVDFGSAWPVERSMRRHPGDGATRPYAAPELLSTAVAADFRADIFAHAVILYELLTLKIPYGGLGGTAANYPSKPVLEKASSISPDQKRLPVSLWLLIDEFLANALSLNPDERFSDRGAWLRGIDEIHLEMQRRSRLDSWNEAVAGFVTRWFGRVRPNKP